jgi:hypothetical protein
VVDADCISGLNPSPVDTPRSNWLSQSVAKAWNALPEELRPRAVVISFRKRGVQSAGFMWAMLDLFDIEGIPAIAFPLHLRSLDASLNRVAKQDPVLLDDVVRHLDDLVSVAHNNWVRLKMPGVNKLPVGEVQEGGV